MSSSRWPAALIALAVVISGVVVSIGRDDDTTASGRRRPEIPGTSESKTPREDATGRTFGDSTDLDAPRLGPPARSPGEQADKDTLIVRFREGVTDEEIDELVADAGAKRESTLPQLDSVVISVDADRRDDVAAALELNQLVDEVDENRLRHISADPDDEGYFDQGHLFVSRLPVAWEVTKGSSTLDIAIVDTGVDLNHPDLDARIVAGYDFVNNDSVAMDDVGHGTMVAGIAAAETNNGIGVAGVAWNARIMPIKVLADDGSGDDFGVASGIVWAADHGAEVINLSLGGPGASSILDDAVAYAVAHGSVVVAAAGNEGTSEPSYPAAIPDVVSVGATDLGGDVVYFSNYGPWVDLVAPGTDIVSTALGAVEDYAIGDGTSFASPIVAGAALLMRAKNPTWTPAQIASKLASSAADRGPDGIDDSYGRGLLDAYGAVGGRTAASPPVPAGDALEPNDVPDRASSLTSSATASISPEGDADWYFFDATEPGTINFTVNEGAGGSYDFDPVVTAFSPDLRRLMEVDEDPYVGTPAPNSNREKFALPVQSGRYYFRVTNELPSRTIAPGTYSVAATFSSQLMGFGTYETLPVNAHPESTAIGDVNGDGRNDVLLATSQSSGIATDPNLLWIFLQLANGTLGQPTTMETNKGIWLTTGDDDGDGDTDVAVGSPNGIDLFQHVDGSLVGPTQIATGSVGGWPDIGDVTGDGKADIVANGPSGTQRSVLLEHDGTSWTPTITNLPWLIRPEIGDMNGDGRMDLTGRGFSHSVLVLERQDDGSFVEKGYDAPDNHYWHDIAIGDLTGDGRPDVVGTEARNRPLAFVDLLAGDPSGTLTPTASISSTDVPEDVVTADMNGDGLTDIVTVHGAGTGRLGIYRQTPEGTLEPERLYALPDPSDYNYDGLSVGDIDNDGHPDVAAADRDRGLVLLREVGDQPADAPQLWGRSSSIPENALNVPASVHPTIVFARALDPGSVNTVTSRILDATTGAAVAASVSYQASTRTLTLTPSQSLKQGRPYMVHVASVRDVDGETMSTSITSRFSAAAPNPPTKADVNGDGYDDVIVGAPDEDFGTKTDAGVVHVLFGSATGTKTSGSQMFTQDTANVPDTAEAGDRFGAAIATGDVNNDGYDDVAVGVPGENVGSISDAGAVHLMLGSSTGLRATGSQFWTQDSSGIPDAAQTADRFGSSLAFGDFDNTAGADLAVGSPNETLGTFAGAGAVHVLSGRSGGLTASGSQFWTQQNIDGFEAPGNKFGTSLASVDFDGDTHDDLAIGAPYEDIFEGDEGTVTLMRGTIVGLRPLFSVFSEILTGVEAAKGERFGASLSSEDFGGLAETDGYEDLAVGAPGASSGAGRVDVLYSDWIGPLVDVRSVEQTGNGNDPEAGDAFGGALAAGRFKGSPYAWLAIAATGEDFGSVSNAGVVHLVTPKSWIASSPSVTAPLTEDTTNIPDSAETEDRFGNSVRLLDVDKDGKPDMIVGVPNETVGSATLAGRAYVIRNAPSSSRTAQMLNQGSGGVPETAQGGDRFGFALGG